MDTPIGSLIRRSLKVRHMDIEFALEQMYELLVSPRRVYSVYVRSRRASKRQMARDDPAFTVLVGLQVLLCAIAYGIGERVTSPLEWLGRILYALLIEYGLVGLILSAVEYLYAVHVLSTSSSSSSSSPSSSTGGHHSGSSSSSGIGGAGSSSRHVEALYAWDVHCNAFYAFHLIYFVLGYVLYPLLTPLLSGLLFCVAVSYYAYIVFAGYLEVPHVTQPQSFLYPLPALWLFALFRVFLA